MKEKGPRSLYLLLDQVFDSLNKSVISYQQYLQNGKTFALAGELKKYNTRVRKLLSENSTLIPGSLQKDRLALIAHYDAWTEKWNDLEKELQPAADDVFVFQNEHRFPREAANNLEEEFLRLRRDEEHKEPGEPR